MKRHHKTPKMSRIRVAAFKKRQKDIYIKKHPKSLASLEYNNNVINCTIPIPDKDKLIEEKCPWNKDRKLVSVKSTNETEADKWYTELRDKAKEEIRKNTYNKEKNPEGKYKYKGKRKPWYMLDTRKTCHYEQRTFKWGDKTEFFRVPSEASVMYNKTVFKPKGLAWYMEQLTKHKLSRWEKKNPCPVNVSKQSPDLFEEEYVVPWKAKKEAALEHFRNFVVSIYDKLPLSGRFKKSDNECVEEHVAEIKDINMEGHKINELEPGKSKLLDIAQKKTNAVKAKRPNLICTNLKDHRRQKGRIILPKAALQQSWSDVSESNLKYKKLPEN